MHDPNTLRERLQTASQVMATLALAISLVSLLGHALAISRLYSFRPGLQAMSIVTGAALALVAGAHLLRSRLPPRFGEVLGAAGIAIGTAVLASHAAFGADVLDPVIAGWLRIAPAAAGQTSVSTALGIAVLSVVGLPSVRARPSLHDPLTVVPFLLSVLAMAGYTYGSADLYAVPFFQTMSLNAALAILLLACGAIAGNPGAGWAAVMSASGEAGEVTRRQLLFLLFPPVVGWCLVQAANAGHLRLGGAMALLVVVTIAPLLVLILRDGRTLADLAAERALRASLEAGHLSILEGKLAEQAVQLDERNQARLQQAELATLQSEGRYRQLFDSIDAGFCVIEMRFDAAGRAADYRFVEVNAAFEPNTGLHAAAGQWMRDLAPDHEQHWFDVYGDVARTGTAIRFELPAFALGDRWYDVHAFPVGDRALGHVGLLFNDISDRRRAQQALKDVNATLEQRVASEIAEREQAQAALRQSQKMEAIGQLTGGVAHDFNNLLTPIVGVLDMLARHGTLTDRERRLINGGLQSAERATTLVQRLLAFARRQPLQTKPIDLTELIAGMADLVGSTSGPHIRLVVETAGDLPPVLADANQLEMAILNLCVNARDAMPDGGTLTIASGEAPAPTDGAIILPAGRYVRLTVADTGIGMDADTAKRATEPFFSTKGLGKGTGLGLSMVHGLMGQLGGAMDIHSQPGHGTRIDLWVPVSDRMHVSREGPPSVLETSPSAGRALVVDDEIAVRTTTADMLQDLGYQTVELASAREAHALLMQEPFDLVVTDHLMPGMTGAELALVVRRMWPDLPVLIVSGFADVADLAPEIPRLAKPFRQDDLRRALLLMGKG